MQRNVILLMCLAVVFGVCGSAAAVDVPEGQTKTLSGTVVDSNTLSNIGGTLIIDSGADVTIENRMIIDGARDFESGVGAEIIMNGDSFHLLGDSSGDRLSMGYGHDAYLIINSGLFRIGSESSPGDAGDLKLGDDPGGVHRIYLNGGTLRAHRMEIDGSDLGGRNSHVFVGGGTLIVEDLSEGDPSVWATTNNQTTGLPVLMPAEGYENLVIADYNSGKIVTASLGPQATTPDPVEDEENICPDAVLSWTAGPKTQPTLGHDVYFGTDYNDVSDATTASAVYQGRQTATTFDPTGDLTLGAVYYWRVDEVNDVEGSSPWKGNIWSFTVNDGNAHEPDPENDAIKVPLDKVLSWHPGCLAISHDVYFSTNPDDVNNMAPAAFQGNQGTTTWDPCDFDYLQDYYWRIVEHGTSETWVGPVWHFTARSMIVDDHLLLWYEFNQSEGDTVIDSSGRQFHGAGSGFDGSTWDQADGHDGGCISLNSGQEISVPTAVATLFDSHEISVSVWVKGARNPDDTNWLFGAGGSMSSWPVEWNLSAAIPTSSGTDVLFLAGEQATPDDDDDALEFVQSDSNDVLRWTQGEGASPAGWEPDWHHFVFIKNENDDTMSIYFDGLLADRRTDATLDTLATLKVRMAEFLIGASWPGNSTHFGGKIDDFRIYDYALSDADVVALFRGGDLATAWAPIPSNGAGDVARDTDLTWRPGDFAVQHDVYFGTDWDDVNDATSVVTLGVYKGRSGANTYNIPTDLDLGTTYYWRIDEVNDNDPCLWKGAVWRFTVANFILIDNFESYNDSDNLIYDTWIEDGSAWLDLGSGGDPARSGSQSMDFLYFNNVTYGGGYYSEVGKALGGMDLTQAGVVKALTLYFYGDPTNDAGSTEEPYVGVDDGTTYAESPYTDSNNPITDIQQAEWHEWNIAIADLNSATLTSIQHIYIGFGQRGGGTAGGTGEVYFDDVQLSPPKCVPELGPEWDWSGNCIVDLADVGIMADNWLRADANLSISAPTVGPVAWWELDDGSGTTAADSSVNNNTGTLEGSTTWVAGHIGTGAVDFSSSDARIRVPHSSELMPSTVSATAWIYPTDVPSYSARVLAKGVDANDSEPYYMQFNGAASWAIRDPNHQNHSLDGSDDLPVNEWTHLAGTFDGNAVKLYVDGQLDAEGTTGGLAMLQDNNDLSIGNRSDGNDRAFIGVIDDVRVYNYALSADEVAYIATQGTGYLPLSSIVNIYDNETQGQKAVNFRDLAKFMTAWLNQQLWPPE